MGLFELSSQIRKGIGWIGLAIVVLFVLWLIWLGLRGLYRAVFPAPQVNPKAAFGKLSPPSLPNVKANLEKASFKIDTIQGVLPSLPAELPVYQIPRPGGTLTSLDEANAKAKLFGFTSPPKKISETAYLWTDSKLKAKSLRSNIVAGEFLYKYDPSQDPSILKGPFKITEQDATREALAFLRRVKALPEELDQEKTKINFYKITGKKMVKVTSFSESNAVEILFFRKPIAEKYQIFQANPNTSLVRVVLGANLSKEGGVLEAEFIHWNVNFGSSSTYPLRGVENAWRDFQQSNASFIKGALTSFEEISLADISLAYFETKAYQPYLEPIYVLEGTGSYKNSTVEFVAFLPAVADEYLEKPISSRASSP
ncbi:MAG: hypothetical protein WD231_00790 [Candidatus Woykebacteria bacterium]